MAKVIGIGGVFFKSPDPAKLNAWYAEALGVDFYEWGGAFFTAEAAAAHPGAGTVFSPFRADTEYFAPSSHDYMLNLMVDDLDAVLARAKGKGAEPLGPIQDESNGRFAHLLDPDGRKIELWQPAPCEDGAC